MTVRVADYIAQRLREWGVDTAFLLSGGGMMHLVDAVGRAEGMRYICNHHEQACAMAADGYARRSGKLGVCYATSGPGGTNTLTGIVGAWQDSVPVMFLVGQSKTTQTIHGSGIEGLRQFGTFEVDIVPIVKSVTKYAEIVMDPKTIRYHLEKAYHLAMTGRPGPVLLDLPLDVQGAQVDPDSLKGYTPEDESYDVAQTDIARVAEYLKNAKRPLVLAGYGVRAANAVEAFRSLVKKLNIPVATTQLGKDVLPYEHPLFVGHTGPKGDRPGNFALQTADVIISLGCSLHSQTTGWEDDLFAPDAIKIQVDLDPAVLAREKLNVTLKIQAGVSEFIAALAKSTVSAPEGAWQERCREWKERFAVKKEPHKRDGDGINFYSFIEALSEELKGDESVVTDAGSAFYILGQAFRLKGKQRFISSGSLGTMGFALPAAIGAAAAAPDEQIVSVTGDGSLMTNIHDLATLSKYNLNVKLYVINNDGYSSIRNTQNSFFAGHLVGTDPASGVFIPDMADLAKTFKLTHIRCEKEADLAATIRKVSKLKGPVLCEIMAMRNQQILPTVTSVRLPDGRMKSKPIHDMFPLIEPKELEEILSVEEHEPKRHAAKA